MAEEESLLQFPCRFPIKAMGRAEQDFDALVVELVRRHAPDFNDATVKKRHSRCGRYVSITVTIIAQSREQLDSIYYELTANDQVLVAL